MAELDKAIERLQKAAKAQDKLTTGVVTEVGRNRRRLNAVETQGNDHGRRLNEHDDAIAEVRQRAADIEGDVGAMATVVNHTTTRVEVHTQQIETHDNWFTAVFDRLGPQVLWGRLIAVSLVLGVISMYFWYTGVYEQFEHSDQHVPEAITRIVSVASGLAVFAALVIVLSFLWTRVARQTAAEPAAPAAATATPEPAAPPVVIVEELPPPPAAPAPATEPAPAPPVPVA